MTGILTMTEAAEAAGYGIGIEPPDLIKKLDEDLANHTKSISLERARLNHQELNVVTRRLYNALMESKTTRELRQVHLRIGELRKFVLDAGLPHKVDPNDNTSATGWEVITHTEAFKRYINPLVEAHRRRETEIAASSKIEKGASEQQMLEILEATVDKAMKAISA